MAGYALDEESIGRLARMLRAFESGGLTTSNKPHQIHVETPTFSQTVFIQVTGAISGSYYPANVVYYSGGTWTSLGECRAIELNTKALTSGRRYFARYVGPVTISGTAYDLFAAYSPGEVVTNITCSSGTLTVTKEKV